MLSTLIRNLAMTSLKTLLEKCEIPSSADDIKKKFNVSITFSDNEKGEKFATVDTRLQDNLWRYENKHTRTPHWRESDKHLYNFTVYSDSFERSLFMAAIVAIKPDTCLKHLAMLD